MKNSYKFIALGVVVAGLFGTSLNAFAASNPASFLPDSAVYLQFNAAKPHPFQGQLQSLFNSAMTSSPDNSLAEKLFAANLDNTVIGFSQTFHLTTGKELFLVGFAMDADAFQKIISSADSTTLTTENLGLGRIIYTSESDFFFTYKDGNVIAANNKDLIHDQLFTTNPGNLSQNTDYQNFLSKISPDSFLLGYLNFDKLPKSAESTQINSWLTSEAFAISQDLSSLSGKLYVNFKKESGWNSDKYLFTPALYTRVNDNNLIFYQESNNLTARISDALKMLSQMGGSSSFNIQDVSTAIASETGINIETDLLPLFQNRYAWMVHSDPTNTDWTMPAFSLITEVKDQESNAQALLNKFQTALETQLKAADQTYTIKDIAFGNSTLKQLSVTYQEPVYSDSTTPAPTTTYIFTLDYGITSDGLLVVSTFKDPANLISGTGLTNDSAWKSVYTSQQLMDVSILNFANLKTYLDKMMAGNGISQDIDKLLAPLHYLTTYTTGTGSTVWANFSINLDITQLGNYQSAFTDLFNTMGFNPETLTSRYQDAANPFSDVQDQDWFKPFVDGVRNAGLMQGYNTEFRPNQFITRAEFVKVLIQAAQYNSQDLKLAKFSENFQDVDGSAWYSAYINQARANGFVTGYQDGSFHPNSPITRAEAMQMLVNSDPALFDSQTMSPDNRPFTDVKTSDWFFTPIYRVFDAGLVSGKNSNSFSPNTNLTRAEAAKIISLKLGLK
jgi:hypothetical protein